MLGDCVPTFPETVSVSIWFVWTPLLPGPTAADAGHETLEYEVQLVVAHADSSYMARLADGVWTEMKFMPYMVMTLPPEAAKLDRSLSIELITGTS
jgi:hypothetical protein